MEPTTEPVGFAVAPPTLRHYWTGWGRPNLLVEPGMQWVATRTSVNIWHKPAVKICCRGGSGTYSIERFDVSRFPSHRLWVNGVLDDDIVQGAYGDLWTPLPGTPSFVIN